MIFSRPEIAHETNSVGTPGWRLGLVGLIRLRAQQFPDARIHQVVRRFIRGIFRKVWIFRSDGFHDTGPVLFSLPLFRYIISFFLRNYFYIVTRRYVGPERTQSVTRSKIQSRWHHPLGFLKFLAGAGGILMRTFFLITIRACNGIIYSVRNLQFPGPLSNYLSEKYSYRTVTLIAGTIASFGLIASFFASSLVHLCIT